MAYAELEKLAQSLPNRPKKEELLELAGEYKHRHQSELVELAVLAANVHFDSIVNLGLEPDTNPQLEEAIRWMQEHDYLPEVAGFMEENGSEVFAQKELSEEATGYVSVVKGTYFEVMVRDKLNNGENIGGFMLAPGQEAVLADDPQQLGWDLAIVENGEKVLHLQAKARVDWSAINEASEEYPVITVQDHADNAVLNNQVYTADVTNADLTNQVKAGLNEVQFDEMTEGPIDNLLDQGAESALDSIPMLSIPLILATEVSNFRKGNTTRKEALKQGARRLRTAATFDTIGVGLNAVPGVGQVASGALIGLRLVATRISNRVAMGNSLEEKTGELRRVLDIPL